MSTPEGTTAPETSAPVVPPAPAPVAPAPEPPAVSTEPNPAWLAARLDREKKALLRKLGFEDETSAKATADAFKAAQEAAKTDAQRAADQAIAYQQTAAQLAAANAVIARRASLEMSGLTDQQKAAIVAVSGEDAGKQLTAIDAFKATWTVPASPPVSPPIPAPATTVPLAPPPPPAVPGAAPDYLAQWKSATASGQHVLAAATLAAHPEIATGLHK